MTKYSFEFKKLQQPIFQEKAVFWPRCVLLLTKTRGRIKRKADKIGK